MKEENTAAGVITVRQSSSHRSLRVGGALREDTPGKGPPTPHRATPVTAKERLL